MKQALKFLMAVVTVLTATPALAASSGWIDVDGARLRLIMAPEAGSNVIQAGLQIDLKDGWKTYWRNPGQSGIPPQIAFFGSRNVKKAEMELPVPKVFDDGTEITAGYKGDTVFPIRVTPDLPGSDVTLNVSGMIGVCAEICVPVPISLSVTSGLVTGTKFDEMRALFAAFSRIPGKPNGQQRIEKVIHDGAGLTVDTIVPEGTREAQLLVEGPEEWYLQPGKFIEKNGAKARFSISLIDLPKNAEVDGKPLRYTLIADGKATDETVPVGYGN